MPKVVMYATGVCPYCVRAEALLKRKGVGIIEKIRIDLDPVQKDVMIQRTGRRTVPQIFIDETHVGGCDDLYALERQGRLDLLLNKPDAQGQG
jgi:glutaredoxin 3